MNTLLQLVDDAIARHRLPWRRRGAVVEVSLWESGHSHRVHLERRDDRYRFWSVVVGAAVVTRGQDAWRNLAYRAWRKNALKEMVGFSFDCEHRLIGLVEQPAATVDREELVLYVETVARECERFEYKLSGHDRD